MPIENIVYQVPTVNCFSFIEYIFKDFCTNRSCECCIEFKTENIPRDIPQEIISNK